MIRKKSSSSRKSKTSIERLSPCFPEILSELSSTNAEKPRLDKLKQECQAAVYSHILQQQKLSGSKQPLMRNAEVQEIVGNSKDYLIPDIKKYQYTELGSMLAKDRFSPDGISAFKPWDFHEELGSGRWNLNKTVEYLEAVDYFLPSFDEYSTPILKVLPYLLTCYTMNISRSRVMWNEQGLPEILTIDSTDENRSKKIRIFSSHFITLPQLAFAYPVSEQEHIKEEPSDKNSSGISDQINWYVEEDIDKSSYCDATRNAYKTWEVFRRYAAFAVACSKIKAVNISISTSLLFYAFGKMLGDSENSRTGLSYWNRMEKDYFRSKILSLCTRRSKSTPSDIEKVAWLTRCDLQDIMPKKRTEQVK